MARRLLPRWASDIPAWLFYPLLPAIYFWAASPFLLYAVSSSVHSSFARELQLDTKLVSDPNSIGLGILFLISVVLIYWWITPNRRDIEQKVLIALGSKGRGLFIPLAFSAIAFYVPLLFLAWNQSLGISTNDGFIVATPLIQSSFNVYLVVLSITALIRYFFLTATVQTGIAGFTRKLTADLRRLASRGQGQLTVSLPWLALGKRTLDPELFSEFRDALEKCFSNTGIIVKVYTLHPKALCRGARTSVSNRDNKIDKQTMKSILRCEAEIRQLVENRTEIVSREDLLGCVIINEKLYAVHTLLHKAQEDAHLGNAFISTEIDDERICEEYKKRLELIDSEVVGVEVSRSHIQ